MKKSLLKKRFWLAASTHKGEDVFCLKTHLQTKKKIQKYSYDYCSQDILKEFWDIEKLYVKTL